MSGVGDIRERRRQRILGNSEERMKKLMGINEKFAAEHPTTEEAGKSGKKDEWGEKKVRKISFGNMVANNKMAEKLRKERKISLNLERIWPINEEGGERKYERESGRRGDLEVWTELKRPSLRNLEALSGLQSTEAMRKEVEGHSMEEELKKMKEEEMNEGRYGVEEYDEEEKEEEEGFNEVEGRMVIENYEAKLRSLEDFARRIEQDDKERAVGGRKVPKEDEELEDGQPPPPPGTSSSSPPSSSRPIFMLLIGVLCRLFISLLPLHLQNIMLIFTMIELVIASYQYLFQTKTMVQAHPHIITSAILTKLGVSKEMYRDWSVWMGRLGRVMEDLSIFLFSFLLLHHCLHDPLACDFDAR